MKLKQIIIPVIFLSLVVVGSLVGVYLVRQQQLAEPEATVQEGGEGTMFLSPGSQTVGVNESFTTAVTFQVNGGPKISDIEAEITYSFDGINPFNVSNPTPNQALVDQGWRYNFQSTDVTGNQVVIKISASSLDPDGFSLTGPVELATIRFSGASPGTVNPEFVSSSSKILLKTGTDTLAPINNNFSYTVSGSTEPSPDPSPSPSDEPSPNPSPSDEPSPDPSPSDEPTTPPATDTPTPTQSSGTSPDTIDKRDISVTNVTNGQTLTDTTPTFIGRATDLSDIDIDITRDDDGTTITGFTTTSTDGDWTWTVPTPLAGGNYTGTFISTDEDGDESSTSVTFIISTTTGSTTLPDAGTTSTTLAVLSLGMLFLISGVGFTFLKK